MPTSREDIQEAYAGDIVALAGLKDTTTGDTLCAHERADHPRADGIPRARHRAVGRAQDQGRPGEDGRRAQSPRPRGSVVPRVVGRRERPDDHQGDGRAPPRDPRRSHEARVQGRGERRRAAGGVSRVCSPRRSTSTTPTRSSRAARASSAASSSRSSRASAARASIFKDEVKGGNIPKEYIPSVEKGIREIAATGSLIGFPIIDFTATLYDGAYHDVDSSALAFEITGRAGDARSRAEGRHQAARADHEGRGRDARRIISATSSAT